MADARVAEAKRLLKRHSEKGATSARDQLADALEKVIKVLSMTDVAHWIILARFLAKGGQQ